MPSQLRHRATVGQVKPAAPPPQPLAIAALASTGQADHFYHDPPVSAYTPHPGTLRQESLRDQFADTLVFRLLAETAPAFGADWDTTHLPHRGRGCHA
jgi:hypothetical protein